MYIKKIKPIIFIIFLLVIYIYVSSITMIPEHIVIFEGEKLNIHTLFGINLSENKNSKFNYGLGTSIIQTATNLNNDKVNQVGKINLNLNLFNKIPLRQIDVDVIKKTKIITIGNEIGIKLYTKGDMVTRMYEIQDQRKKIYT